MGWETGISLGANAVSSFAATSNAQAESKSIAATAENVVANQANQTSRNIGSLETSFLKGGIALNGGAGTSAFFNQAAQQGQTDISRTIDNANASIANTMSAARTKALSSIGQGFAKLGSGTISAAVNQAYQGSWLQSAWNGLSGNPDPSPQGSTATVPGGASNLPGGFGSGFNWGG